ncbi:DUF871 domain-containing protein [Pectinatus haikarae]|uniref:DUF871 domain-containing protein n=1 Tax=Pectinatus haikarae TaxID=349096 RepID=UPI0018C70E1A|nr:MupG family TIM beta-alpha barrel fold protein [Pectinatus haikarae]
MDNGISLYPGLENTFEENLRLLNVAAENKVKRIFTSFHVPETNFNEFQNQFNQLMKAAAQNEMEVISDVSPAALALLGAKKLNLSLFRIRGIRRLRLDYGYDSDVVSELSRNTCGIGLQLNASAVTADFLSELEQKGADFSRMDALHNFYPRPGTGLSEGFFKEQTKLFQKKGIKVGAFVPSFAGPRLPLRKGLPTMEEHRRLSLELAARHLCALGADSVFIGDGRPSEQEIKTVAFLQKDTVILKVKAEVQNTQIKNLLQGVFTARLDEARDAVRAQEGRDVFRDVSVEAENTSGRSFGTVTLDNNNYLRYKGEVQLIKNPQPADEKVNVVGKIIPEELFMLKYITPGKKFSLEFI